MPDTSNTITTEMQYDCNTSETNATRVLHKCDTIETRKTWVWHECYTNDTSATQVENIFDNDTGKTIFSHPYIYYMASERLQEEEQLHTKNYRLKRTIESQVKMNARFWKNIWNKGKVTLDSFRNIFYVCICVHLKCYALEERLSNILKTTNVTNLTKFIQKSSYKVLQVTSK